MEQRSAEILITRYLELHFSFSQALSSSIHPAYKRDILSLSVSFPEIPLFPPSFIAYLRFLLVLHYFNVNISLFFFLPLYLSRSHSLCYLLSVCPILSFFSFLFSVYLSRCSMSICSSIILSLWLSHSLSVHLSVYHSQKR